MHRVVVGSLSVRQLKAENEIRFVACVFVGDVELPDASVTRGIAFHGCSFLRNVILRGLSTQSLAFNDLDGSQPCSFYGDLDLMSARIASVFDAKRCRFWNPAATFTLNGGHIGTVTLEAATVMGGVDFRGLKVDHQLDCDAIRLENPSGNFDLNGSEIGQTAFFRNAVFQGSADLSHLKIGLNLECNSVHFANPQAMPSFNSTVVGDSAFFPEAFFDGDLDFAYVSVDQLVLDKARFTSKAGKARLDGVKARSGMLLRGVNVSGMLSMIGAESLGQIVFDDSYISNAGLFDLEGIRALYGAALLRRCHFSGDISLAYSRFGRTLDVRDSLFGGTSSFRNARVDGDFLIAGTLGHDASTLPPFLDARGFSFESTDLNENGTWRSWIRRRRSVSDAYDPEPYLTLERSFRRSGLDRVADEVHYELRLEEGRRLFSQIKNRGMFAKWIWNLILRATVGYGVYGARLLGWVLGIAAVVYAVAWYAYPSHLAATTKSPVEFSAALFAIDLLIPALGLKQTESWRPHGHVAHILLLLRLVGWLLLPLAAAQVTGLLKKRE